MEISKAISAIIPYYDYVLGIETRKEALEVMFDKNMILYGPPGTGKTYNTAIYAVAICDGKSLDELTNYKEVMARYNELKSKNRIIFTTFHQSYGYEEFIEGIKPIVDSENNEIGYTIESGIFKKFCENARKSEEIDEMPYVFIIDEINRGNISKIFGELITLIEDTKREGMPEAVSAILPYSSETFSIPSNVYILGTMNTADRSIALMDTALRRRFQFVEMMPNSDVIRKIHADKVIVGNDVLDVAAMLDTINERITFLYDREHTIGHSFFIGLATNPSIDNLAGIFSKSIIPLLQEYFYEDYQKIQLVLGDNSKTEESLKFIKDTKVVAKNIFKGSLDDIVDLPEKKYEINNEAFTNILSYIEIM
jgi:5-methylcytosine-specific restriction endonuclease McrBC GTP-binding regulatory subunit McrB